jgi:alpha-beta hydrolase superfamily lysophospholipase
MKIYFKNQAFSYQLLRALSYAPYSGAEIGECLATAARIHKGDFESWHLEWSHTAQNVGALAEAALGGNAPHSARELFLRANNYYRTAEFFLSPHDPRRVTTYEKSRAAFRQAIVLMNPPVEQVHIPYEGTTLPGYFYRVDDSDMPRPTVLALGGFDSTGEELYFFTAAAALRRGYNCLAFEGPGQGEPLRVQHLPTRPDYEVPVGAALDFALRQPEVDPERLAVWGISMGGYYAPRAAAFDARIKACVVHGAAYDFATGILAQKPLALKLMKRWPDLVDNDALFGTLIARDLGLRWMSKHALWVFGVSSRSELLRTMEQYALKDVVARIHAPTLLLHGEKDHFIPLKQAYEFYEALNCPKQIRVFTTAEGAEEHCQIGNLTLLHQVAFDWLDEVFAVKQPAPRLAVDQVALPEVASAMLERVTGTELSF